MASLVTEARKLVKARLADEAARLAADKAHEKRKAQEQFVWDLLDAEGITTITLDLGEPHGKFQFGKRATTFGRIFDEEKAVAWMDATERGLELSKRVPRRAQVNELVRERIENKEPLPPGVDFYETQYVQLTRRDS